MLPSDAPALISWRPLSGRIILPGRHSFTSLPPHITLRPQFAGERSSRKSVHCTGSFSDGFGTGAGQYLGFLPQPAVCQGSRAGLLLSVSALYLPSFLFLSSPPCHTQVLPSLSLLSELSLSSFPLWPRIQVCVLCQPAPLICTVTNCKYL